MAKAFTLPNQDVCAEILLILIACFAPWAYGSVDASSEFVLYAGVFAAAGLRAIADWRVAERSLGSGPAYWALLAFVGIALLQASPLSDQALRIISPGTAQARLAALPPIPETVRGDSGAVVKTPESTISLDPNETWHGLVRLAAIFLLFDCASRSRLRFSTLEWFAKGLVLNATLLSIFSLIQAMAWNGKIYWVRDTRDIWTSWHAGGPFFCHNHLAASLNIGLGFSLGLLFMNLGQSGFQNAKRLERLLFVYSTGVITAGVFASHSRGGLIATAISLFIIVALLRIRPSRILPGMAAILGLLVVFLLSIGISSPLERLATIPGAMSTGFNGRDEVWKSAFETWKACPILGTGFGTYAETTFPNFHPPGEIMSSGFPAHGESEYVEMLVEGGLVGLGLLLVAVFDIFQKTFAALRRASKPLRPLVLGGLFGIIAISTQSLADFPLHLAGITVPAVILASKLYRLGLGGEDPQAGGKAPRLIPRHGITLKNVIFLVMAGLLIYYQASQVKLELLLERANLPLPGTRWITADIPNYPSADLKIMKAALIESLKIRPNWAEGHTQLGQVYLGLYRHAAAEALGIVLVTNDPATTSQINNLDAEVRTEPEAESEQKSADQPDGDINRKSKTSGEEPVSSEKALEQQATSDTLSGTSNRSPVKSDARKPAAAIESAVQPEMPESAVKDPLAAIAQTDPLWLHKVVHSIEKPSPEQVQELIEYDPVREFLIPAARSFLEARRCCPVLAVPYLQLASLDYLLNTKESGLDLLKQGIALKGNQTKMLLEGAVIAANLKKLDLAVSYWRDYLQKRPRDWELIAGIVANLLKPNQILEVAKGGGVRTIQPMATQLYSNPFAFVYRVRFMEAALACLPQDTSLSDDERLWFEGRIRGELAQYDVAKQMMRKAIERQPLNEAWYLEYIETLISWDCHEEAYKLALTATRYFPKNSRFPGLMKLSLNATAQKGSAAP